jgi:steroid 5-alpha reductase family enzyme
MSLALVLVTVCGGFCALTWVLSLLTREYSWVDRIWSISPWVYIWIVAAHDLHSARLVAMAVVTTLWGVRLTFNFARKGGYSGVEDYRWAVLRARMSRWQFQLFNLFFIVLYQNVLLLAIALPAYDAYVHRATAFNAIDVVLIAAFLALLIGETIADQQQWTFHQAKDRARREGRDPSPGFLQTGLFAVSRHPNYFCEIAQWWVIFLFAVNAACSAWRWDGLGAIFLTLLFIGSTRFTEEISSSKYPDYRHYQARVSAIVPWFPKRSA